MSTPSSPSSLPYEEPSPLTIAIYTSFILSLNIINYIFDRTISCGLIGQILVGVAWGTPGAGWLSSGAEELIVQLGYLGLVLLVYEGGLQTSLPTLLHNLRLSSLIAITGISLPISLSYLLLFFVKTPATTPLQAFAAGAALCSTSLGTTFSVLSASGLVKTRMGVVLSTAAMLDDVVGLVVVQVISNLGPSSGKGVSAATVSRPVFVSIGFAVVIPGLCWGIVRPVTGWIYEWRLRRVRRMNVKEGCDGDRVERVLRSEGCAFMVHTLFLVAMVMGSSYAGTSNLFAAYLAGVVVSWWDGQVAHPEIVTRPESNPVQVSIEGEMGAEAAEESQRQHIGRPSAQQPRRSHTQNEGGQEEENEDDHTSVQPIISAPTKTSGTSIFEKYYQPTLQRILKPFFFASIGFSIPISRMFSPSTVWRGLVYSVLMFIAKLACGLWLVRLPGQAPRWVPWKWKNTMIATTTTTRDDKAITRTNVDKKKSNKGEPTPIELKVPNNVSNSSDETTSIDHQQQQQQQQQQQRNPNAKATAKDSQEHSYPRPLEDNDNEQEDWQQIDRPENTNTMMTEPTATKEKTTTQQGNEDDDEEGKGGIHERRPHEAVLEPEPVATTTAAAAATTASDRSTTATKTTTLTARNPPRNPLSLYPSLIVGGAMTARGEIGFLISSLAQSNGIFNSTSNTSTSSSTSTSTSSSSDSSGSEEENSPIFLIVTWAIMLCTLVGPVLVGVLVRRVRRLEGAVKGRRRDVLGVWGVS